jgi:hypothetical protein
MSKTPKKTQTPLELFQEAYHVMHGKHTKYTTMDLARPKYYAAHKVGTLEAYLAAAHFVLDPKAEEGSHISMAKKKISKAVNMCIMQGMRIPDATAGSSPGAGGRAMPAVEISEAVAAAYAEQAADATGGGLRVLPATPQGGAASPAPYPPPQRSPMDKALILTSAPPREAPPQESTLAGAQRVVMSASARVFDGVRVLMAAGKQQAPAADVGQKRLFQEEAYTDRPTKTQAVGARAPAGAAGGKAAAEQARAEVVYAKMGGVWNEAVQTAMQELDSRNIFKFDCLFVDADKELSTLTPDKAVACLKIMRNFETDGHITNANHHFVRKARLMRELYDLQSADDILEGMKPKKPEASPKCIARDKDVFGWDFDKQCWRQEVQDALDSLFVIKKCVFCNLDKEAEHQLRTLELHLAILVIEKTSKESKKDIRIISEHIVKTAEHYRNQHGMPDVQAIYKKHGVYYNPDDTESEDEKETAPKIKKEKKEKEDKAEVNIKQEKQDDDVILLD